MQSVTFRENTAYHDKHFILAVKHGGREVMIWVCFSATEHFRAKYGPKIMGVYLQSFETFLAFHLTQQLKSIIMRNKIISFDQCPPIFRMHERHFIHFDLEP